MTVIKRGQRYGVRVKRAGRQVWIGTFATRAQAKRAEAEALIAPTADVTKLTVSELADLFHEQHTTHKEASTRKNYRRATSAFTAYAHDRRASAVTFIEAQAFANAHPRSVTDTVSTMYEWARKARILADNPFDGVIRRQVTGRVTPTILTEAQVVDLASVAVRTLDPPMGEDMAALILVAAGTGMRPAELFALTWGDVDFSNGRVSIDKSVDLDGNLKAPKNGRPREAVLLAIGREGLSLLERRAPSDLIFQSNTGGRLSRSKLAYRWHAVRREAGAGAMRFYDLRHTCATRLLELGAYSYEVAEQLGHQDAGRLVERTYGHPSTERALDRIAELDRVASELPAVDDGVAKRVATGPHVA